MRLSIRYKLVGLLSLMGLLPLLAALAVVVMEGTELRTYSAGQDFLWVARAEAGRLALVLRKDAELYRVGVQQESVVSELTQFPPLPRTSEELRRLDERWPTLPDTSPELQAVLVNPLAHLLRDILHSDPHCREILLTDRLGQLVAATEHSSDFYQADEDWWQRAYNGGHGQIYISPVEFDASSRTWSLSICLPIYANAYRSEDVVGVIKAVLDLPTWMEESVRDIRQMQAEPLLVNNQGLILFGLGKEPVSDTLTDFAGKAAGHDSGWYFSQGKLRAFARLITAQTPAPDSAASPSALSPAATGPAEDASAPAGMVEIPMQAPPWYLVVQMPQRAALGGIYRLSGYIAAVGLILIAVIFGGGLLAVTANIVRPLEKMRAATDRVASGDLPDQIVLRRRFGAGDEIGAVIDSFNRMVLAVKSSQAALTQASEMKSRFIRIAGHELRTPVSYIIGMTELLAARTQDVEQRRSLEKIRGKALRLDEIITEMFKALPTHAAMLSYSTFRPSALVEDVLRELRPFVEVRGQKVVHEWASNLPEIKADREKVHDILVGIITNAVNFSCDGGLIRLNTFLRDSYHVAISVADQCGGISHDEMPHIFEPFYGGRDVLQHSTGKFGYQKRGAGLGLTVARHFISMQSGTIEVANTDVGCVFTIVLPIHPPYGPPDGSAPPEGIPQ